MHKLIPALVLSLFGGVVVAGPIPAPPADANDLGMEVNALQTIHQLELTAGQLQTLAALAKGVGAKDQKRDPGKVSAAGRKVFLDLREAYARNDAAKIDSAVEKLDALYEKDAPDLDDAVTIADASRRKVADLVRVLTAKQVAGHLAAFADDWEGPTERLLDVIKTGRKLPGADWVALKEATAEEVAWLLAGCDDEAYADVKARSAALLDRARGLSDAELQSQLPKLELAAEKLASRAGPVEVLKHALERDLAELLSNPRLLPAIEARLSGMKK